MGEESGYNGWKNYETWCVHLWLTNEEPSYRYWREEARRHVEEAAGCSRVREGIWSVEEAMRFNLADQLKDEVEHDGGCSCSSLYSDLTQAALSVVDWVEIAEAFLEGLTPDGEPEPEPEGDESDQADDDDEEAYSADEFEKVKAERAKDRTPRFELGQVVSTPGALAALTADDVGVALFRHHCGDWGDVGRHDWRANEDALADGSRLFSVYRNASGTKFWVITEADRSVTTVLLPDEY